MATPKHFVPHNDAEQLEGGGTDPRDLTPNQRIENPMGWALGKCKSDQLPVTIQ